MSQKLKILLEKANEKEYQKDEDGTLADLGPAPTGHLVNKQIKDDDEDD